MLVTYFVNCTKKKIQKINNQENLNTVGAISPKKIRRVFLGTLFQIVQNTRDIIAKNI